MQKLTQLFEERLTENLINLDSKQVLEEDLKNLNQLPEGYKPYLKYILQNQRKFREGLKISPNSEIYQVIDGNASRFAAEINKANKSPNKVGAIIISSQTHLRVLVPVDDTRGKLFSNTVVNVVMDEALSKYALEVGPQKQRIEYRRINSTTPYKMNEFITNEARFSAFIICEDPAIEGKYKDRARSQNTNDKLEPYTNLSGDKTNLASVNRQYKLEQLQIQRMRESQIDAIDVTVASDSAMSILFDSDGKYVKFRGDGNVGKFILANKLRWSNVARGLIIGYLEIQNGKTKTVIAKINGVDAY